MLPEGPNKCEYSLSGFGDGGLQQQYRKVSVNNSAAG